MVYVDEYQYGKNLQFYQNQQVSNFRYDGNRFKADVNMNSTNILCAAGGMALGAAIAYYLLKK